MSPAPLLFSGEHRRTYDERYRIALPTEWGELLSKAADDDCMLAKERYGCLSLWNLEVWRGAFDNKLNIVESRAKEGTANIFEVQRLSRLLSTRSKHVKLGGRSRLLVPEGFREFLHVEPNSEIILVGAGPCIEMWNPVHWQEYLKADLAEFQKILTDLT